MTTDMYFPAMPGLQDEFDAEPAAIQATLSVFLAGLAGGQLLFGPLSDRFGRRGPLLWGLAIYVAGCLIAVGAASLWVLLVARFLQAIGAAAGLVIARAIVTDRLSGNPAARMQSLIMLITSGAAILAPLIGGWFAVHAGWRWIFLVLGGFGIASLVFAFWGIAESLPGHRRSASLLAGQLEAWSGLCANRRFVLLTLASSFTVAAMYALLLGSAFVFIDQFGWQADHYGLLYGGTSIAFIAIGIANDRALRRWPAARMVAWSLFVQLGACLAMMALAAQATLSASALAVLLLILVGNVAFVHGNLVAVVMEEVREAAGTGAGLLGAMQYGMSALVPAAAKIAGGTPLHAMAATTLFFAVLAMPCFFISRRQQEP